MRLNVGTRRERDLRRASHALDQAEPERACHALDPFEWRFEKYRDNGTLRGCQADRLIADSVRITVVLDCG